jgi:hypothetical protein
LWFFVLGPQPGFVDALGYLGGGIRSRGERRHPWRHARGRGHDGAAIEMVEKEPS